MSSSREPWFVAPEAAAPRHLRLIPSPPLEPVTPRPDPIVRRGLPGAVLELARDAVVAVWGWRSSVKWPVSW